MRGGKERGGGGEGKKKERGRVLLGLHIKRKICVAKFFGFCLVGWFGFGLFGFFFNFVCLFWLVGWLVGFSFCFFLRQGYSV